MIATILLVVACGLLFTAIMRRDEKTLLLAITAYAGATFYIVTMAPELFVPAALLAIAMATLGLIRFIRLTSHSHGGDPS